MALQAVKRFRIKELVRVAPDSALPNAIITRTNPFVPHLNTKTGRWTPPKYSLRQQADLVKKAKQTDTLALLPPGPKLSVQKLQQLSPVSVSVQNQHWTKHINWQGDVKERALPGAEIGNKLYAGKKRMFKGHKWERVLEDKAKRGAMLMRDMKKRITRFKKFYQRRRPNPLKPPRTGKNQKLPF